MRILTNLFVLILLYAPLHAQTDSSAAPGAKPGRYDQIAAGRKALLAGFLNGDHTEVQIWKDSLARLEDDNYAALVWDERWLLYVWEGSYGNLFEEVAAFDERARSLASYKIQPQPDSLYEWLDHSLYEQRYDLFQNLRNSFLSEEERVFSTLIIEYLLRMNTNALDWNNRVDSFAGRYPNSRFNNFLKSTKTFVAKPGKSAWNLAVLFHSGTWRDELDRTLTPLYAGDFGIAYWKNRWNVGVNLTIGSCKLDRDVYEKNYLWPKKDAATFIAPELEIGYDIIRNAKMRVYPALGGGMSILRAPQAGDEEEPLPDYYYYFKFRQGFAMATLTTDIKLGRRFSPSPSEPEGSYNAVRLRLGYRRMFLGEQNPALEGDMLFIAVGLNFHIFTQVN